MVESSLCSHTPQEHITDTSFRYTNGGINASLSFNTEISATLDLKILNNQDEVISTYTVKYPMSISLELITYPFPLQYLWSLQEPNQVEIHVELRDPSWTKES